VVLRRIFSGKLVRYSCQAGAVPDFSSGVIPSHHKNMTIKWHICNAYACANVAACYSCYKSLLVPTIRYCSYQNLCTLQVCGKAGWDDGNCGWHGEA
jgi:hypothetical protein